MVLNKCFLMVCYGRHSPICFTLHLKNEKKNKQNDFAVNEYRITRAYQNVLFMHILWHIHTLASHFEIFSFITEQTTINSNHKAARLKLTTTDSEKKKWRRKNSLLYYAYYIFTWLFSHKLDFYVKFKEEEGEINVYH